MHVAVLCMLACLHAGMHACLLAGANVIDGANFIRVCMRACLLRCLLAGANVIDGALGQVIKVTLILIALYYMQCICACTV